MHHQQAKIAQTAALEELPEEHWDQVTGGNATNTIQDKPEEDPVIQAGPSFRFRKKGVRMTIRKKHARPVTLTEQQLEQVTGGMAFNHFPNATTGSLDPQNVGNPSQLRQHDKINGGPPSPNGASR